MPKVQTLLAGLGLLHLWLVGTAFGQELKHLQTLDQSKKGEAGCVQFDKDEKLLVGYCRPNIKVWDWPTRKLLTTIDPGTPWIENLTLHPDGKRLAFASVQDVGRGKKKASIKIWDLQRKEAVFSRQETVEADDFHHCYVALHPHKNLLAFTWANHKAIIWDLDKNRQLFELTGHTKLIGQIAFSPDGEHLVTGSNDWALKRWDVSTGRCTGTIAEKFGMIESLCFRRDGKFLYVGGWYTLREVDMTTFKTTKVMKDQHTGPITGLALIRDESVVVSIYHATVARLYDLRQDKNLADWRMALRRDKAIVNAQREWVAVTKDEKTLVTASEDGRIEAWEIGTR